MKVTFSEDGAYTFGKALTRSQEVTVSGTWGSGTMTIAVIDGFSGDAVTRTTITADDELEVLVGRGKQLKLTLSGSTNPSLTAYVDNLYE